jgi:hypothetical protein
MLFYFYNVCTHEMYTECRQKLDQGVRESLARKNVLNIIDEGPPTGMSPALDGKAHFRTTESICTAIPKKLCFR